MDLKGKYASRNIPEGHIHFLNRVIEPCFVMMHSYILLNKKNSCLKSVSLLENGITIRFLQGDVFSLVRLFRH